jgi:hypothetical protein
MTSTLTISATAAQTGYGSGLHRVRGLSATERQRAMAGERIFYRAERKSQLGATGTFWRVVRADGNHLYPRVPTEAEVTLLRAHSGVV